MGNLKDKTRSSFTWDLIGTGARQLSTLSISIVLARILEPEEFGIIGMAMVFVTVMQVFIDVGFTEGIIQKKEISHVELSTVFFLNIAISLIFSLIILFSAPFVSDFYKNESVGNVLVYLSIIPLLGAAGRVHASLLTKNLDFKSLTIRDLTATIISGVLGIIAALLDYGVYSLVIQQISFVLIGTALLWVKSGFIPSLTFSFNSVKELMSFSTYVFFDSILQSIFRKADTVFIGKIFSPAILGFYTRAESLNTLINNYTSNTLAKIIFPVFSKLQDDSKKFISVFEKAVSMVTIVTTLMSGLLYFSAENLIVWMLGAKWLPSVIFFKILVFKTIILPLRGIVYKSMLSKGLSKLKFKLGILDKFLIISSLPIGYFFGIEALAWAVVTARAFMLLYNWLVMARIIKLPIASVTKKIIVPILSLIITVVVYELFFETKNGLYFSFGFLISHLTILHITKNYGYLLVKYEVSKMILNRVKVNI